MIPKTLAKQVADIYYRLAEIERRGRNRRRKGKVAEVGTGDNAGKYRVQLSEPGGKPYLSDWIRPRQLAAGGVKIDVLYGKGEQVDVVPENGDLTDAQIDFSTYSAENARENTSSPLHIKIGDAVFAMSGDELTVTVGKIKFTGDVEIEGDFRAGGGVFTHNDKNVGHNHGHVSAPPGASGPPV